jgi:hypothetical protein
VLLLEFLANHADGVVNFFYVLMALTLLGGIAKIALLLMTLPARMRGELFCRECGRMFTNKAARFCGSCGTAMRAA